MGLEIRKQIVLGCLPLQILGTQHMQVKQAMEAQELQLQPETVPTDVSIYLLPLSLSTLSFS